MSTSRKLVGLVSVAVAIALAAPSLALATHMMGFGHANNLPATQATQVSCTNTPGADCLLVTINNGSGVTGWYTGASVSNGVVGRTDSTDANSSGVYGFHQAQTGTGPGVRGETFSTDAMATGVRGVVNTTSGASYSAGVRGISNSTGGSGIGVHGRHAGSGWGVHGETTNGGIGVFGFGGGPSLSLGVYGVSFSTAANSAGVFGQLFGGSAANQAGVRGENAGPCCGMGVAGFHTGNGIGLYGEAQSGFAVSGFSPNNWSGYFQGSVRVVGNLQKNSGSFTIDHPLEPANKYLSHSFVESPDMMNVYNGNVVTDRHGLATVRLPRYFTALNKDFRYQLTTIGQHSDAWIAREISGNRFALRTEKPRVKVSWQVTGIRKDRWANAHRIKVEELKKPSERGKYLNPELYGQPATKSVVYLPRLKKTTPVDPSRQRG